jgi:hypothetical protein
LGVVVISVTVVDNDRGSKHGPGSGREPAVEAREALQHAGNLLTHGFRRRSAIDRPGGRHGLRGRPVVPADTGRVGHVRATGPIVILRGVLAVTVIAAAVVVIITIIIISVHDHHVRREAGVER